MNVASLDLRDHRALVVGGGPEAAARARDLLDSGALLTVVAPRLCDAMVELCADDTGVIWHARKVVAADLDDMWWVSAPELDDDELATLRSWCEERRVWLDGSSARMLPDAVIDQAILDDAISLQGSTFGRSGKVVLVGGGPGAADLLTVRGRRELAKADVVVTDRLAPVGVVESVNPGAEIIDVGKTPYHHPVPQHEINRILVERAQRGQYVVRLKGGDPFVLGRGGEELAFCRAAGVEVEVIPGVTSAFAAPAAADVPVTHRGVSTGVLLISGHDSLETSALAGWPHTIVVLMGMARLRELATSLIEYGKDAQTPVTVIHRAWTDRQRVVRGDLQTIADAVADAKVGNPSVIVIGDVNTAID